MSGKVFDQIDPATEPETTSTETTDAPATETTNVETTENTDTAETNTASTTASTDIEVSNVYKADIDGKKRDKTAIDVVLVRTETKGNTVTVFYKDKMKLVQMPASVGPIGSTLDDGGLVMGAKDGKVQRTYATLRLTLDDLADKIAAIPDDAWQPRHKNRLSET